jgi:DNA-binding SARP family transcriptional activator
MPDDARLTADPTMLREIAADLFRQAERCAGAGMTAQAVALLDQARTLAARDLPELADLAAWEAAWLQVGAGDYRAAAAWFDRVASPPRLDQRRWPLMQAGLRRLCLESAGPAPAGPPAPPREVSGEGVTASLPPLSVVTLGRLQIRRAGQLLPNCRARKSLAVFRYLLTTRHRAADKEELMEIFWVDVPPREAAHSLHMAISTLRHYLDPGAGSYLRFEAGRYVIEPAAPLDDDAATFRRALADAERDLRQGSLDSARRRYGAALAGYAGDYYTDERDLPWALAERERLLALFLTALDHLARLQIREGRWELAIDSYQRLVERDGYREDAHCQLMRCFYRLGRRGEALRQYEQCAALLARELGVEPMPETRELRRLIADGEPAEAPDSLPALRSG